MWKNDVQYTGVLSNLAGTKIFKWWVKGVEYSQSSRVAEAAAEMAKKVCCKITDFHASSQFPFQKIIFELKRANQASITEAEIRKSLPLLANKVASRAKEIQEDSTAIAMKALKSHGSSLLKRKHEGLEFLFQI